ncbi:MAG: DUF5056 domain-containing protein [Prevotellaceae bacterium]|nr:DUF5056 domain-containing protein [Prevotellaceae bacterium]
MMKKNADNNDIIVGKFLKEYSVRPADNGFTERVMRRLPRNERRTDWLTMLQYAIYVLAALAFIFFGGKEMLQDIFAAHGSIVTMLARIAKYGIYITIGCGCAVLYTLYNIYSGEHRRLI